MSSPLGMNQLRQKMVDGAEGALMEQAEVIKIAKRENKKNMVVPQKMFGVEKCMTQSGKSGGTPMVSRPGKQTIASYLCFSNGVKYRPEIEIDELDPTKNHPHQMKEALKR